MKYFPLALTLALALPACAAPNEIGIAGALPDLAKMEVESPHVYDYTFTSAPTDWKVESGVWEMTNRWSCSPGWSWFGGRSDETAAIWNKRKFQGDISAQVYFAFKMGLSGSSKWQEYPTDVAVGICGDGANLGTGYTFIAGADDNTHSILLKNGKIVADTSVSDAILPRLTDGLPGNELLHRRWWYARIDKVGNRIEARLDDKLILSYTDPDPIKGGQSNIWTYNNGIMLARVQLFYQKELRTSFTSPTIRSVSAPEPKARPKNTSLTRVAQRGTTAGKM